MLSPHLNESGEVTYHYVCPVSQYENWEEARLLPNKSSKYSMNLEKFAKYHSFDDLNIGTALNLFRKFGSGKHMKSESFHQLRHNLIQICKLNKSHLTMESETQHQIQNQDQTTTEVVPQESWTLQNAILTSTTAILLMGLITLTLSPTGRPLQHQLQSLFA